MSKFDPVPGAVYVQDSDGRVAVNFQGLPVEAMVALLDVLSSSMGSDKCVARNAHPRDGLGPGAWYVLAPRDHSDATEVGEG